MAIRVELTLRLPNSPWRTGGCRLPFDGVNILAMGRGVPAGCDNHIHGAAVLREHHHQVTERDVLLVMVPNVPGSLAPALRLIGDAGVNVDYAYGGGSETGPIASIVIGVENAQRASAAAGV